MLYQTNLNVWPLSYYDNTLVPSWVLPLNKPHKLILILERLNTLISRLEFLSRNLKIAIKIRDNSNRLIINNYS